jgi:hypothetical protein
MQIKIIESRSMRWEVHAARTGKTCIQIFVEKFKWKETIRKTYIGERIILKWILDTEDGVLWTGLIWLRIGISGGLL